MFDAPASGGSGTSAADLNGHILVVEPLEFVTSIPTKYGDKEAIRLRVHDISTQTTHEGCLWFGLVLIGQLKSKIGGKVLGLMRQGTAKNGQAPPWELEDLSTNEQAVAAATAYLTGQVSASLAAPAAPTPAPAAAAPSALDAALGNLAAAGLTTK